MPYARIKRWLIKTLRLQTAVFTNLSPAERELIARIRAEKLTYLSDKKLASLAQSCRDIETQQLPGLFIEAGCALGGSTILMASIKQDKRPFFVYDVFDMIPPPTADDTPDVHERYKIILSGKSKGIGGDTYYGYQQNLYETVQDNLRRFNIDQERQQVHLIKGLVQDTMQLDQPVAFAHVDVDWYEPVMTCLEQIFPRLVVGGSIVLDDYHDWGGCRKATDTYLRRVVGKFELDDAAGPMKISKVIA